MLIWVARVIVTSAGQAKSAASAAAAFEVSFARVRSKQVRGRDEFTERVCVFDTVELRQACGVIDRLAFAEDKEVRRCDPSFEIESRRYRVAPIKP